MGGAAVKITRQLEVNAFTVLIEDNSEIARQDSDSFVFSHISSLFSLTQEPLSCTFKVFYHKGLGYYQIHRTFLNVV